MRPKRFYQYVEKDTVEVSLTWKVLHATIFFLTALTSLLAAHSFANIFDTFNYNCILYAKPRFNLHEIIYKTEATTVDEITTTDDKITTTELPEFVLFRKASPQNLKMLPEFMAAMDSFNRARKSYDWSQAKPVPGKTDVYIMDEQFWIKNDTLTGIINMKMNQTIFATFMMCDLVLFIPLMSLIVASVFFAIVMVCGRGGKGYQSDTLSGSWKYVYPAMIASAIMTILSAIILNMIINGLEAFCSHFEQFTGKTECTPLMDLFTVQQRLGVRKFWRDYTICYTSFYFLVGLWVAQLSVTILRVVTVVDFQFTTVLIRKKNDDFEDEEALWDFTKTPAFYDVYKKLKKEKTDEEAAAKPLTSSVNSAAVISDKPSTHTKAKKV